MMRCPFTIHLSVYSEEINEQEVALEIENVLKEKFGQSFPSVRIMIGQKRSMSEHGKKIWRAKNLQLTTQENTVE